MAKPGRPLELAHGARPPPPRIGPQQFAHRMATQEAQSERHFPKCKREERALSGLRVARWQECLSQPFHEVLTHVWSRICSGFCCSRAACLSLPQLTCVDVAAFRTPLASATCTQGGLLGRRGFVVDCRRQSVWRNRREGLIQHHGPRWTCHCQHHCKH